MAKSMLCVKNVFEISASIDKVKEEIIKIKAKRDGHIPEGMDSFSLFYLAHSLFSTGKDFSFIEPEAINVLDASEETKNRIKALTSTLSSDIIWVDMFAFNAFACAVNDKSFNVGVIEDLSAKEISWAIIMLLSFEGANNLPLGHQNLIQIGGMLKADGYTMPPLPLGFKNIFEYTTDAMTYEEYIEPFKNISIFSIREKGLDPKREPWQQNLLGRSAEISEYIKEMIGRLTKDWASLTVGKG